MTAFEKLCDKIDIEMSDFKSQYAELSPLEVYNDSYKINFYESFKNMLCDDLGFGNYNAKVVTWLSEKGSPIDFLYEKYMSSDFEMSFDWDDMMEWVKGVYFEEKRLEKQDIHYKVESLGLKAVPITNDKYFEGFHCFAPVEDSPIVFSANSLKLFDDDVDKEFATFFKENLLVKCCDYGLDTYPGGVTKVIEDSGEYTFKQQVWNFIEATEQMFNCKCQFVEGYNGFDFVFEFGSEDNKGCYVLAAGNNGQEYTETLYLSNPEMIRDPEITNTIISIDKALYTLLEENSLKREDRNDAIVDIKRITKNDLLHCDTVFDFERPKTQFQSEAVVDYVELEVIKPERFEKLARNLARCGNTDGWDKSLLEEVNNKDSNWYEHIMLYVHIMEGVIDKIYTECTTCDDCDSLVTEQVFDEDEIEIIKDEALRLYKENEINKAAAEKTSLSALDEVIKHAEGQKSEQNDAKELNVEPER